jgi:hypothetical protein
MLSSRGVARLEAEDVSDQDRHAARRSAVADCLRVLDRVRERLLDHDRLAGVDCHERRLEVYVLRRADGDGVDVGMSGGLERVGDKGGREVVRRRPTDVLAHIAHDPHLRARVLRERTRPARAHGAEADDGDTDGCRGHAALPMRRGTSSA